MFTVSFSALEINKWRYQCYFINQVKVNTEQDSVSVLALYLYLDSCYLSGPVLNRERVGL